MSVPIAAPFHTRVRRGEPMAQHSSWRAGGAAEVFFTPRDVEDLAAFLGTLPAATPIYWMGLGSNLLVRDGGLAGVVISTHGAFTRLERRSQTRVYCEAGVPCVRIARQCIKWGLGSAGFFSGIPGTAGGALAMNAGAFGGETWRYVVEVHTIDRAGLRHQRAASEFRIAYREVRMPVTPEWFLAAEFEFPPTSAADANLSELTAKRKLTQPLGEKSCGSVFKNPPGDHAARLIEATGLKGYRIGDAVVSDKHANFILNTGQATARDLEALVRHVQAEVQRVQGITLQPEVRIVGDEP